MQSRGDKERKLKRNVEVNTARAIKNRQEELKRDLTADEKNFYRTAFQESAERIDRSGKLMEVWNSESQEAGSGKSRPAFGYFSGVTIKNGKLIR